MREPHNNTTTSAGTIVQFLGCAGQAQEAIQDSLGACWTGSHLALSVTASIFALGFVTLALCAAAVFADRSPGTDQVHATVDGRANAVQLLQQTLLIMVYGLVGADSIPGWVAVLLLLAVGTSWVWYFVIQQPHAVPSMNSLRASCGSVFLWAVVCLVLALILPGKDMEVLFYIGSVFSVAVAVFVVHFRRLTMLRKTAAECASDIDLSLWARVRLQLAHSLQQHTSNNPTALWLAGGALFTAANQSAENQRPSRAKEQPAANADNYHANGGSNASSRSAATMPASRSDSKQLHQASAAPRKHAASLASDHERSTTQQSTAERVGGDRGGAYAKVHQMLTGGSSQSKGAAMQQREAGARGSSMGNISVEMADALVQGVHIELSSRNDDAKLPPYLLILLADIRRQFLNNRFMELMALSQAQNHTSVPWDVQFWVSQRLQVLRSAQEHASGEGGLSPVERLLFDQYYQWAVKYQRQWYSGTVDMWKELKSGSPDFRALQQIAQCMGRAVVDIEFAFEQLMKINRNSTKVLKAYGNYLSHIKRNETEGANVLARAERLESAALERSQREVQHLRMMEKDRDAVVVDESAAVVVVNGELARLGEITAVNAVASSMFKRPRNALLGQNVKLLMPSPISDVHDMFLRAYAASGHGTLMNTTRSLVALDAAGNMFPVRATLRESPPLEGSSAPQFTMLMQPLKVAAEHHVLFLDAGQGYQITCCDADSYRLFGISYQDLQETPVSIVQFFPEIDLEFSAAWEQQQHEFGGMAMETEQHGDLHSPVRDAQHAGGGPDLGAGVNISLQNGNMRPLLGATRAFMHTQATNTTARTDPRLFVMIQEMRVPHAGTMYLLSWKYSAKLKRGSATRLRVSARQLPQSSATRPIRVPDAKQAVTGSTSTKLPLQSRKRQLTPQSGFEYPMVPPPQGNQLSTHEPGPTQSGAADFLPEQGGCMQDELELFPIRAANHTPDLLSAAAVQSKPSPNAAHSLEYTPTDTARAAPDSSLNYAQTVEVPIRTLQGVSGSNVQEHASLGSEATTSAASSLAQKVGLALPEATHSIPAEQPKPLPAIKDSRVSVQPSELWNATMSDQALEDSKSVPPSGRGFEAVPQLENMNILRDHSFMGHQQDDELRSRRSLGGSVAQSAATGASAASRKSSAAKLVLASTLAQNMQHPAVRRLQASFALQFACLVTFSIVLFVLRQESVEVMDLFVESLRKSEARLLHAQTAVALVSALVLHAHGIQFENVAQLSESLQLEASLFREAAVSLQSVQGDLANALGGKAEFGALYKIAIPSGTGSSMLSIADSAAWLDTQLQTVISQPVETVSESVLAVRLIFNASDDLLLSGFPDDVRALEARMVSWLETEGDTDAYTVFAGLGVSVVLMGALALVHIHHLAAHRNQVLMAVTSVALRDVKQHLSASVVSAREHLAQLVDADQVPADEQMDAAGAEFGSDEDGGGAIIDDSVANPVAAAGGSFALSARSQSSGVAAPGTAEIASQRTPEARYGAKIPERIRRKLVKAGATARGLKHTPRIGEARDTSHFRTIALAKLMLPTVLVFVFVAGLWLDWYFTSAELIIVVERTFGSEALAVRVARALGFLYTGLRAFQKQGKSDQLSSRISVPLSEAVQELSSLITGTGEGSLTGRTVPALDGTSSAFTWLVQNACTAHAEHYDLSACGVYQAGLLGSSGLRGGVLRFSTLARSLADQLDAGTVSGTNSTLARAALAAGDTSAWASIVAPPSGSLANATSLLHTTMFPYVLGISEAIADSFREGGADLHSGALDRSRAFTILLVILMAFGSAFWIWPAAIQLGRDVFSTHALVAAIPSDVALRVPKLRKVLQKISSLAAAANSQDGQKLSVLDNLAGLHDMELGEEPEEVDAGTFEKE